MQKLIISITAIAAVAAVAGCNNAKSPSAVADDVAAAQAKASSEVANAKLDAAKDSNTAEGKVEEKTTDLNDVSAKGESDVAMAKADGDLKVMTEKCNIMSGTLQQACKDKAQAAYDMAKANVKAMMAGHKP